MIKTRTRTPGIYTICQDGQPVAQAEAISRAEALALWVASQQHPTLSARLSTPREARALAHLPLLSNADRPFSNAPEASVLDLFDQQEDDQARAVALDIDIRCAADLLETHRPPVEIDAEEVAPDAQPAGVDPVGESGDQRSASEIGAEMGRRRVARFSEEFKDATEGLSDEQQGEMHLAWSIAFDGATPTLKGAGKVAAMYRNPETGESWSGRGLKPRWMVAAQEAGRTMEDFLIPA